MLLDWPSEYRAPGTHSGWNHSWIAVGMIGGALIGGISQNQTNKANKAIAKDAGKVDITTTRTGDPRADPYRDAGMAAAYNALFPGRPLPVPNVAGTPMSGPPGHDGPNPNEAGVPDQYGRMLSPSTAGKGGKGKATSWTNAKGQTMSLQGGKVVKGGGIKGPATPGGGGTTAPAPFKGMSTETDTIRKGMMGLPDKNAGMYDAVEDYSTGLLRGESTNPLVGRATAAADDIAEDPGLAEYIAALKAGATGGGGGAKGGRNVSYGYAKGYTPGSGGVTPANQKSATGANEAIRKMLLGEMTPGMQANEDAIARRVNESRAANIRELRARAVGSGFYGGSVYSDLESGAIAKGDQELAGELAAARYGAYQNALQQGTQYDLGMANIAADERNSSRAAAAAGAGAAADAASREKLANLQMWGDALGMGMQGRTSRAGALGDLAGLMSQDQRSAAEGVNTLAGSRRADYGAAGDLSLGADRNRNDWQSSANSLAGVRAGVNLGRAQLAFDKERFYDPLERVGTYGNILNTFYGGMGSETTKGVDKRNQSPAAYGSVGGAALSGAAIGGQTAAAYRR